MDEVLKIALVEPLGPIAAAVPERGVGDHPSISH